MRAGKARSAEEAAPLASCRRVTVIVPVYRDYEATRRCLDGLRQQLTRYHHAIVIDDASPEAEVRDYVRSLAGDSFIECLFNIDNLGFVGTVNRALQEIEIGDVLLLNADTVIPPKLISRLAAAAHSSSDIGTVTPLSNNGEFTSFPRANEANELDLNGTDVAVLDRLAASANAGCVVEIPNGIGFCMYLTRRCLDAVGPLSDTIDRGYLEDVDVCLRAREAGLRNVCAPSVFVGHAGSRSFGESKRALVVRNLRAIESRYPSYREECASFLVADPLRRHREAIERRNEGAGEPPNWLVCGPGLARYVVKERARKLISGGIPVVVLQTGIATSGTVIRFYNPSGASPQSIIFEIGAPGEIQAVIDYSQKAPPRRVEIADPAGTPGVVLDLLLALGIPCDVLIADAGLVCRRGTMLRADDRVCSASYSGQICEDCISPGSAKAETILQWQERCRLILAKAATVFVPCARAKAFASRM